MRGLLAFIAPTEGQPPTWPRLMSETLIPLKLDGWEFDRSWSIAEAQYPPPFTWRRSGPGSESPYDFFKRHCEAAWDGRRGAGACADCGEIPCGCEVVEFGAVA